MGGEGGPLADTGNKLRHAKGKFIRMMVDCFDDAVPAFGEGKIMLVRRMAREL
jgi:hypothetical protein